MIEILIDTTDFKRITAALDGVEKVAKSRAAKLPFELATRYYMQVLEAVVTQKYASDHASVPYNDKYAKWKTKEVGHLKFWWLRTDLMKSLSVFKLDEKSWCGGILPGATNSEGKLIRMYAEPNERLRPLFSKVREDFITAHLALKHSEALDMIGKEWK
jgi:hypothetical protein